MKPKRTGAVPPLAKAIEAGGAIAQLAEPSTLIPPCDGNGAPARRS